jgi:hypothetical protein
MSISRCLAGTALGIAGESLTPAARKFRECAGFSGAASPERAEEVIRAAAEIASVPKVSAFVAESLVFDARRRTP